MKVWGWGVASVASILRGGTSVDKGCMAGGSMPCWRSQKHADVTGVQSIRGQHEATGVGRN